MTLQLFPASYSCGLWPLFISYSPIPPTPPYSSFSSLHSSCSVKSAAGQKLHLVLPSWWQPNWRTAGLMQKYFLYWWQKSGSLLDAQTHFLTSQREFDYLWELSEIHENSRWSAGIRYQIKHSKNEIQTLPVMYVKLKGNLGKNYSDVWRVEPDWTPCAHQSCSITLLDTGEKIQQKAHGWR